MQHTPHRYFPCFCCFYISLPHRFRPSFQVGIIVYFFARSLLQKKSGYGIMESGLRESFLTLLHKISVILRIYIRLCRILRTQKVCKKVYFFAHSTFPASGISSHPVNSLMTSSKISTSGTAYIPKTRFSEKLT